MVRSLQINTNTFNLPTIPIFSLSLIVKLRLSRAGASVAKYLKVTFRNSSLPFCGQSAGGFEPSLDSKGGSDNDKELPSFELKKGDFDIILDRKTSNQINPTWDPVSFRLSQCGPLKPATSRARPSIGCPTKTKERLVLRVYRHKKSWFI